MKKESDGTDSHAATIHAGFVYDANVVTSKSLCKEALDYWCWSTSTVKNEFVSFRKVTLFLFAQMWTGSRGWLFGFVQNKRETTVVMENVQKLWGQELFPWSSLMQLRELVAHSAYMVLSPKLCNYFMRWKLQSRGSTRVLPDTRRYVGDHTTISAPSTA